MSVWAALALGFGGTLVTVLATATGRFPFLLAMLPHTAAWIAAVCLVD